jgi:phage FluMu gp28-like protein
MTDLALADKSPRLITEDEWVAHRASFPLPAESTSGATPDLFLPYQKRVFVSAMAEKVTIVEKSRRTGVTWAACAAMVMIASAAGGMDCFYIGYNLEMAREAIDTCADWAKTFNQVVEEMSEFLFEDEPDKSIKAFRIRFASGKEIVALPSRPRSLRGMQGFVCVDEAAFHDDLDELLKAAFALLMWGGRVLVISTHNGVSNPYNLLVKSCAARGGEKHYSLIRVDLDEALDEGLARRIMLKSGEAWSPDAEAKWRADVIAFYGDAADEELYCIPSEGDGAWLPAPLIEARARAGIPVLRLTRPDAFTFWAEHLRSRDIDDWCKENLAPILKGLDPTLAHYLGGDYGRISDLTVLWPLAVTKTLRRVTPFVVEMRNVPFDSQRRVLAFICDRLPRFSASKHDATGLGFSTAEFAVQQYGELRTEAVMLNVPWYRENAQPLKTAFEDDWIEIPADADIASDLRLLVVKNGVPQVPALKSGVKKDRHGDAAVALMLAYAASKTGVVEIDYTPAPRVDDPTDWLFPENAGGGRELW